MAGRSADHDLRGHQRDPAPDCQRPHVAPPGVALSAAPLILTLALERTAQERFDRLRREHFPPERNHLAAHVTLFHQLPGEHLATVRADVERVARRPAYDVRVTRVRSLGGGVAFVLGAPELTADRRALAQQWEGWLTSQDRQGGDPHVTVQNKVSPRQARLLHAELSATFSPFSVGARGLALWRYLNGPWEPVDTVEFAPPRRDTSCSPSRLYPGGSR